MARKRREYSAAERGELWERWKRGESVTDIARALDRVPATIYCTLRRHGGIAPPERRRSRLALTHPEREEISRGIAAGKSARRIAALLGRSPSTITREIDRHGGRHAYRAAEADERAWDNARRPQTCKLARDPALSQLVAAKLAEDWSPEQIAGWLKAQFPRDQTMRVSHETIYLTLFIQARGALKRELVTHLRRKRYIRRPKSAKRGNRGQGQIVGAVSIRERPAEAEDRAIPGHWEGDLIAGGANTYLATLVERHSRFVMLVALDGKDTRSVTGALSKHVRRLPQQLRSSLTWDRGTEMAEHAQFTVATDVKVYFCDPQSPWQRGSNENTNGLLRQYLPKGTDLSKFTQPQLDAIAAKLNTRPRETLGFKTPAGTLEAALR
ncbi:MAG: IS30 family transposase [Solirubrobacterales bacterium]|nr:IS30 family transposase [Solirubrobacterales bacterium]